MSKTKAIVHWIGRHLIWIGLSVLGILGIYIVFRDLFWQFFFALFACLIAEGLALGASNVAAYVFTNLSFTKGLFYGEDDNLNYYERSDFVRVLGHIFVGVHILFGIVLAMFFWANTG